MIIMSVDYGMSRTGIAVCDSMEILASPVTVIFEKDMKKCAVQAAAKAKELRAELIVVGLPRRTDGKPGETEVLAKQFADKMKALTGKETVLWDERFTTVSAHYALDEMNVHGKKRKNVVDALAAVMILENYLSYRKNTGQL